MVYDSVKKRVNYNNSDKEVNVYQGKFQILDKDENHEEFFKRNPFITTINIKLKKILAVILLFLLTRDAYYYIQILIGNNLVDKEFCHKEFTDNECLKLQPNDSELLKKFCKEKELCFNGIYDQVLLTRSLFVFIRQSLDKIFEDYYTILITLISTILLLLFLIIKK